MLRSDRGRLIRLVHAGLLALAVLAWGCAKRAPLDSLEPEGHFAREIDRLFKPIFWVAVAVFVLVEGALVYALWRFRHRREGPAPRQVHGNTRLEVAWTIAPALLLAVIAVPTVAMIFSLAERPDNAMRVEVIGHQWWWEFRYPGQDVVTANEMHIPAGRNVLVEMTSREDPAVAQEGEDPERLTGGVIHSFWVPKLAGKQDVEPGRTTHLSLRADRPGIYLGTCAEFCGISHANMRFRVVAHSPERFRTWLEGQRRPAASPPPGPAAEGLEAFARSGCAGCHTINGVQIGNQAAQGRAGPDLTHFASRRVFAGGIFQVTDENLEAWLRNPPGKKPGARMPNLNLSEQDITNLVAYLRTLT